LDVTSASLLLNWLSWYYYFIRLICVSRSKIYLACSLLNLKMYV